jgi:AAA+ superfamily predicted ATPase
MRIPRGGLATDPDPEPRLGSAGVPTSPKLLADDAGRSTRHLLDRLRVVEARVKAEYDARRAAGGAKATTGGLELTAEQIDRIVRQGPSEPVATDATMRRTLERLAREADEALAAGTLIRLARLARIFGLDTLDEELLLVALAPALDPRFEAFYAFLNDDLLRRQATVGLALRLCGVPPSAADGRARFGPARPLVAGGLVTLSGSHRPLLTQEAAVPDRVVAHLLGDDTTDPLVAALRVGAPPTVGDASALVARAVGAGVRTLYVRDQQGAGAASQAAAGLAAVGAGVLALDLDRLDAGDDVTEIAVAAHREARLVGAGLVIGPVEVLADRGAGAVRAFSEAPGVVVLHGRRGWDPTWSRSVPALLDADRTVPGRTASAVAERLGADLGQLDVADAIGLFRLTPEQVDRAARAAKQQAVMEGRPIEPADLQRGARSQNAAGLERLATRIEPRARFTDLVLPDDAAEQLRQLTVRWRRRDRVLDDWGMGAGVTRGRGVTALFAGASGTGKTMSAEVIAGELGLDLYVIDLSTVVDKYIGETAKNLDRIFTEADRVNGVLLFDEADALFGKRSGVSDAKDRHANVEVAYLLQRMESFDGVAILTTNLASNLDEAFIRRLDAIIDFPAPDEVQRELLWRAKLRPQLPQADGLDLTFLAQRFRMSGAEIQNAVVTAAYLAAEDDAVVGMGHLVRGVLAEHRKMGRFLPAGEFGPYASLLLGGDMVAHEAPAASSSALGPDAASVDVRRAPRRVVSP